MEDKFAEINKLKLLMTQIISMYEEKKTKVTELSFSNNELNIELSEKKETIEELKKQTETLKFAKTISLTEEDKTEVQNKINKIVKEIDKSIGLLNE